MHWLAEHAQNKLKINISNFVGSLKEPLRKEQKTILNLPYLTRKPVLLKSQRAFFYRKNLKLFKHDSGCTGW